MKPGWPATKSEQPAKCFAGVESSSRVPKWQKNRKIVATDQSKLLFAPVAATPFPEVKHISSEAPATGAKKVPAKQCLEHILQQVRGIEAGYAMARGVDILYHPFILYVALLGRDLFQFRKVRIETAFASRILESFGSLISAVGKGLEKA